VGTSKGTTPGSVPVSVNVASLPVGTSTGNVTITAGSTNIGVAVSITVVPSNPAILSLSPLTENFSLTQGSAAAAGQMTVSNAGSGTLQFTAQANQPWLTFSSTSGSATTSAPASLGFTVSPTGLSPGLYTGQITVSDTNSSNQATVTVVLTVTQSAPSIQLSETGLSITAVAGGSVPPPQSFTIGNSGAGSLSWTAQTNTLSGGGWLQAAPASGSSASGQPGTAVSISVSPAGLPVGQYYGSVNIMSSGSPSAVNSPQALSVVLNVVSSQSSPGVTVSTGGVILSGAAGSTPAAQQMVSMFNPSAAAVTYTAKTTTANGTGWLSVSPSSGSASPGTTSIQIGVNLSGLAAGVYAGTVGLGFGDGSAATIQVVVLATGGGAQFRYETGALRPRSVTACPAGRPSFLIPVFQQPFNQSTVNLAAPQTVQIEVIDDCGNPVTAAAGGLVQVRFSNGDAGLDLNDVGSGIWEATWAPVNAAKQVMLQVEASEAGITLNPALDIATNVTVTVQGATATSAPLPTGATNAASAAQATVGLVAPGSYVSIYGLAIAGNGNPFASSLPLPTTLNGTQLLLGGIPMPLVYAGAGQVNALVPQELAPNASYPLVVVTGTTQSVPMALTIAELQPAIYSINFTGSGAGVVTNAITAQLIDASNPASPSDYLTLYCTGLGALIGPNGETEPADGAVAPPNLLYQTTASVTATIGGVNAPVTFAGLTPGLAALYQVNVQVPSGVTPGSAVPIVITATDPVTGITAQSNSVTIAVQ
jgi:uncharacterized protein (TIGR03437 family)